MADNLLMKQFVAGSCFSYILSSSSEALVIDPHISLEAEYSAYLKKSRLNLRYVIDTHTHADHFSLAAVLKKQFGAGVLMYERAVSQVADRRLKDNEEIALGAAKLKVIYTPGHTDDAISLYTQGKIFTADVLLIGSVGRTDFQNGSPESMFDTLEKLKELPDNTEVYPGHDYHGKRLSTIAKEKRTNPYLKEADRDAFVRQMRAKKLPKPFNMDNIVRLNQRGEATALEMVSARKARELASHDTVVKFLDVRSPLEFAQVHIQDAMNVPIDLLNARMNELSSSGNRYIVLCRTGNRSPMAADMLMQSGIHAVKVMQGGILGWQKERFPVVKGEGGISIERQVRLVAGCLVLCGIMMSWFVHQAFVFVPLFVSCGLIFAGLTDNCLMSMLLMKLPYNKKLYAAKLGGGTCAMG